MQWYHTAEIKSILSAKEVFPHLKCIQLANAWRGILRAYKVYRIQVSAAASHTEPLKLNYATHKVSLYLVCLPKKYTKHNECYHWYYTALPNQFIMCDTYAPCKKTESSSHFQGRSRIIVTQQSCTTVTKQIYLSYYCKEQYKKGTVLLL